MGYERPYGRAEGLADRLDDWKHRLGHDRTLPWAGLGILDDLHAAAALLRGDPLPVPYTDTLTQKPIEKSPEQLADEEFFEDAQWSPEQILVMEQQKRFQSGVEEAEPAADLEYDL